MCSSVDEGRGEGRGGKEGRERTRPVDAEGRVEGGRIIVGPEDQLPDYINKSTDNRYTMWTGFVLTFRDSPPRTGQVVGERSRLRGLRSDISHL